jgi:TPP-dependent pyruvate/acetoin dehydrogenase alpha subunit
MPKLVGGITEIAWAWNASAAPENVREWHTNCDPILHYIRELEGAGVGRAEIEHLDAHVCQEADAAARFALASPLPEPQAALHYAFAGQGH